MKKLSGGALMMHILKEYGKGSAINGLRRYGDERDADGYWRGYRDCAAKMAHQFLDSQRRIPKR